MRAEGGALPTVYPWPAPPSSETEREAVQEEIRALMLQAQGYDRLRRAAIALAKVRAKQYNLDVRVE